MPLYPIIVGYGGVFENGALEWHAFSFNEQSLISVIIIKFKAKHFETQLGFGLSFSMSEKFEYGK